MVSTKNDKILELIPKCLEGDQDAKNLLAQEVQNHIYFHCRKILGNEDDALDATQDILLAVFSGLHSLRTPSAFWGWLNQITANTCYKLLKEEQKKQFQFGGQIPQGHMDFLESMDDQLVPERAVDTRETQRMISELIDELPAEQRLCVMMYYYDEMHVHEIAEIGRASCRERV